LVIKDEKIEGKEKVGEDRPGGTVCSIAGGKISKLAEFWHKEG
jgi:hypothetical protein